MMDENDNSADVNFPNPSLNIDETVNPILPNNLPQNDDDPIPRNDDPIPQNDDPIPQNDGPIPQNDVATVPPARYSARREEQNNALGKYLGKPPKEQKTDDICPICGSTYMSYPVDQRRIMTGYLYSASLVSHWLKLASRHVNRICTGCNRKPVIYDPCLLYAQNIVCNTYPDSYVANKRLKRWIERGYFDQDRF